MQSSRHMFYLAAIMLLTEEGVKQVVPESLRGVRKNCYS